jgi:hypothetical protein
MARADGPGTANLFLNLCAMRPLLVSWAALARSMTRWRRSVATAASTGTAK